MKDNEIVVRARKKVESIMEKESIDVVSFERQYLPEIFDADALELSKDDGLPILKRFVSEYFKKSGIDIEVYGNVVKLFKSELFKMNYKGEFPEKDHEIIEYLYKLEQLEATVTLLEQLVPEESDKKKSKKRQAADSKMTLKLKEKDEINRDLKDRMGFLRKENVRLQQEFKKLKKLIPKEARLVVADKYSPKLKDSDKKADDDFFPYPYIFKPPTPPGDIGLVGQLQAKEPIIKELHHAPYCKYCGGTLAQGESICHVCRNKVV